MVIIVRGGDANHGAKESTDDGAIAPANDLA
jgi:hypothetical protein